MAQAIADLAEEKSRRNLNARAMYLTGVLVEWGPYFHGNVDSEARLEHNDLTYANETPTKPGTGDFVEFARKAAHAYAEAVESLVSGDVNDPGLARKVQQTAQPLLLPHALWYEAAMKYRDADEDLPHSGEPSSH
ncbi:MAG: hypothetical protein IT365_29550 [Candidatus Hydrogenedentes bacterium]|nr:hypothetical protein [Candidatus Hydrogenedentota bacterium]